MEDDAAHESACRNAAAQVAAAGLAADGERLDQEVVERFPAGQPFAEFGGLLLQLGIRHGLIFGLQSPNRGNHRLKLADISRVRRAKQARQRTLDATAQPSEEVAQAIPNL